MIDWWGVMFVLGMISIFGTIGLSLSETTKRQNEKINNRRTD